MWHTSGVLSNIDSLSSLTYYQSCVGHIQLRICQAEWCILLSEMCNEFYDRNNIHNSYEIAKSVSQKEVRDTY